MNRLRNIKVKSGIQLKVILYLVSGDPDNNLSLFCKPQRANECPNIWNLGCGLP